MRVLVSFEAASRYDQALTCLSSLRFSSASSSSTAHSRTFLAIVSLALRCVVRPHLEPFRSTCLSLANSSQDTHQASSVMTARKVLLVCCQSYEVCYSQSNLPWCMADSVGTYHQLSSESSWPTHRPYWSLIEAVPEDWPCHRRETKVKYSLGQSFH